MKRALVISSSAFAGAYNAGVASVLCKELGSSYFQAIYACSSTTFIAMAYAGNQLHILENIWRNHADGKKLLNFTNPLYGRNILDLERLVDIMQDFHTCLDVRKVLASGVRLVFVVTECSTRLVRYFLPTEEILFDLARASSAAPFYHSAVQIGDVWYRDGALIDPFPVMKAVQDGYEEIIGICNKPAGVQDTILYRYTWKVLVNFFGNPRLAREKEKWSCNLRNRNNSLHIIQPSGSLPLRSHFDTDKERLNKTFDLGIKDAEHFLSFYQK